MGLFDFLKNTSKVEQQIRQISGLSVNQKQGIRYVQVSEQLTTCSSVISLLKVLRNNNMSFSIYDPIYPPSFDSDKGSYISYSQEKNDSKESWNMTFGNHDWSGGIYNICENIILIQLENLIHKNLLSEIQIDKVAFFSHYDIENLDRNRNIKSGILLLHKYPNPLNVILGLDYIIFGLFSSDSFGKYQIYKLTKSKLFVDKSETWHQKRHTREGYTFQGTELPNEKFLKAKNVLYEYPLELLNQYWNGFYTTGNKNEDNLIIELGNDDFTKTITINSNEVETLPENVKLFRHLIEKLTTECTG